MIMSSIAIEDFVHLKHFLAIKTAFR